MRASSSHCPRSVMHGEFVGPLNDGGLAVRRPGQFRRVHPKILAAPPVSRSALFFAAGEPILPENSAYVTRRRLRKRATAEKSQYILVVLEQTLLGKRHEVVLAPVSEGCEPEVPVEARLIWRVDARCLIECLWLVAEGIWRPVLPVVRALKFDFIPAVGHHRKQSVLIGDAKRFESGDWHGGQRLVTKRNADHLHRGVVEDPCEHDGGDGETDGAEMSAEGTRNSALHWTLGGRLNFVIGRFWLLRLFVRLHAYICCSHQCPESRRYQRQEKFVVQQQEAQREYEVIQKRIVGGENHDDLPRCRDEETNHAYAAGEKKHPHQRKFQQQRAGCTGGGEPRGKMLTSPADPGGQRSVLVVFVHCREGAPLAVAADQLDHARFEIDAEPLPLQQKQAGTRRRRCGA